LALNTLNAEQSKYTLTLAQLNAILGPQNQIQGNADAEYQDGLLFLWCILNRTAPQTNATITSIVQQLNRLTSIMEECKHDILAFNTKVRLLLDQYLAHTQTGYENTILIPALFSDPEFQSYVIRTEQDHNFNTVVVTSDGLMEATLKMYQTKMADFTWDQMSNDQKQAINLMEQFNSLKANLAPSRVQGGNYDSKTNKVNLERMKKKYNEASPWKKNKPKYISVPWIQDGRTYYWCRKHQMYTMHKSEDCKLAKSNNFYKPTKNDSNDKPKDSKNKDDEDTLGGKRLQYKAATTNMSVDSEYEDY
jgi:hypothetical protein